jgi:hypothetical protein
LNITKTILFHPTLTHQTFLAEIEKSEVEKLEHESNGSIIGLPILVLKKSRDALDSQKEGSENNTPTNITPESPMKAPSSAPIPLSLLCRYVECKDSCLIQPGSYPGFSKPAV